MGCVCDNVSARPARPGLALEHTAQPTEAVAARRRSLSHAAHGRADTTALTRPCRRDGTCSPAATQPYACQAVKLSSCCWQPRLGRVPQVHPSASELLPGELAWHAMTTRTHALTLGLCRVLRHRTREFSFRRRTWECLRRVCDIGKGCGGWWWGGGAVGERLAWQAAAARSQFCWAGGYLRGRRGGGGWSGSRPGNGQSLRAAGGQGRGC